MSLSLSDDLLELIIEELGTFFRAVWRRSALVRHSQKALFRSVRIPLVPTRAWKGSVQYTQYGTIVLDYGLYPKTLGFARAINSSPHLAQYLPILPKTEVSDDVARDLTALNRVTDLTLCTILNEHPAICGMSASYEVSMPNQLKPVFGSMLRGQRLRYFSLKEIFQFPGYLLLGASQLEKIHLGRSGIARDDGRAVQKLQLEKPTIGYLRSLVCDNRMSQLDVDDLLEMSVKLVPHGLQLRGIATLEIEVCFRWPAPKYSILAAAERVTHLHLTNLRPHFDTFNPKSFATLSHITLNIPFTVLPDNDPVDQTIADPYLSFCDSFLAKLCNLEAITASYGFQWGRLAEALTTPSAFTKLKRVRVLVEIRMMQVFVGDKGWPTAEQKQDAEELDHNFGLLHDLDIAGRPLDFSFTTKITTEGPLIS
ncbi:hypothetical protein FA13DRAFT_1718646 [Coprinellus micaceus]|uniref:Uncharacterized protein n=1 Tax=Coprinellus micaceus TaxID=71717 RepID=A0A4Y7SDR4_COPMI|nr:hypothetical protein FA13DRAFT_1718646 [Coprinellus micaceus]